LLFFSSFAKNISSEKVLYCYYRRQGGYVFVLVCLLVSNFAQKLPKGFARNFQQRLAMGQPTKDYILVAIRIAVWIQGLFSGFVTIGRYGKWYQPTSLRDSAMLSMH